MIDKNEAPEGYDAVDRINGCYGCEATRCWPCTPDERRDKSHAIFIRKTSVPATLLHPMGSMGEEIDHD